MILFLIPLLIQTSIKISKIECSTQFGDCSTDLQNSLNNYVGYNYKITKKSVGEYLGSNLLIESYLLQYKIPAQMKVELIIKKPKSVIQNTADGKYYLVSSDGVVIDTKDQTDLIKLVVSSGSLKIGDTIDSKYKFALQILDNLNYLYAINSGLIENNLFKIKNSEGITVILPLDGDTSFYIGSIRLIFSRLNKAEEGIRMDEVKEIDLRFKNPVIRKR